MRFSPIQPLPKAGSRCSAIATRTGAADSLARTAAFPILESACETAAVNRHRLAVGANSVTTADQSRAFDNRGSEQSAVYDLGTENARIPVPSGQQQILERTKGTYGFISLLNPGHVAEFLGVWLLSSIAFVRFADLNTYGLGRWTRRLRRHLHAQRLLSSLWMEESKLGDYYQTIRRGFRSRQRRPCRRGL